MKDTLFWVSLGMILTGFFVKSGRTPIWVQWISDLGIAVLGVSVWLSHSPHSQLWAYGFWLLTPVFMTFTYHFHYNHRRPRHARKEVQPGQGDGEVPEGAPHHP